MISGDPKNEKVKDYLLLNRQKYGIKDIKNTNDGLIIFFDGSDIKKVFSKVVSTELKVTLAFSDSGKAPISSDLQDEKTSALTNDGILLKNSGVKKITEGLKIIEQPKAHPQSSSGFVKH